MRSNADFKSIWFINLLDAVVSAAGHSHCRAFESSPSLALEARHEMRVGSAVLIDKLCLQENEIEKGEQ
jgi:hypothetical protein